MSEHHADLRKSVWGTVGPGLGNLDRLRNRERRGGEVDPIKGTSNHGSGDVHGPLEAKYGFHMIEIDLPQIAFYILIARRMRRRASARGKESTEMGRSVPAVPSKCAPHHVSSS